MVMALVLVSLAMADGLRTTLNTPSWTFRSTEDVPIYVGDKVEGYVEVTNKNDFNITVDVKHSGELSIVFNEISKELMPEDTYKFGYVITLTESGTYGDSITVIYSTEQTNITPKSSTLSSMLTFVDIQESEDVIIEVPNETSGGNGGGGGGLIGNSDTNTSIGIDVEQEQEETEQEETETETPETVEEQPEETNEPDEGGLDIGFTTEPEHSKLKWWQGALIGLGVMVVLFIIGLIIHKLKKPKEEEPESWDSYM